MVSNDSRSDFNLFLRQIPCLSLPSLLKKCIFLNYCLHEETISLDQLTSVGQTFSENDVTTDASLLLEETYQKKENEQHNQTYILEEQLLKLVRTGNCDGFKEFMYSESNFHIGVTSSTALRQLKNNIIITTTLCTRAAIEGGLDYDTAYQLSDYFIQSSERLTSAARLTDLLSKVSYTFAEKVAQSKTPVSTDERMQKAIRYIQQSISPLEMLLIMLDSVNPTFLLILRKRLVFPSVHLSFAVNWKKEENFCNIRISPSVQSVNSSASQVRAIFIPHSKNNSE